MKKKNRFKTALKVCKWAARTHVAYNFVKSRGVGKENDIALIIDAIKRISGDNRGEEYADEIVNFRGEDMYIKYNPYFHLFVGAIGSIATNIIGTKDVIVDDNFRKLSDRAKRALLAHELGHYKLEHRPGFSLIYMLERTLCTLQGKVLDIELEADEYACKLVGAKTFVEALEEFPTSDFLSKKEIQLRIKHIKEHSQTTVFIYKGHEQVGYAVFDYLCNEICREAYDGFEDYVRNYKF